MLPYESAYSDQTVHVCSNKSITSVAFVVKSVKVMERASQIIISFSSRVIQPLKHFCCCVTLKLGVRVIAAFACVSLPMFIPQDFCSCVL